MPKRDLIKNTETLNRIEHYKKNDLEWKVNTDLKNALVNYKRMLEIKGGVYPTEITESISNLLVLTSTLAQCREDEIENIFRGED